MNTFIEKSTDKLHYGDEKRDQGRNVRSGLLLWLILLWILSGNFRYPAGSPDHIWQGFTNSGETFVLQDAVNQGFLAANLAIDSI